MIENYQTYESFIGKVSPFLLFEMEFHSLSYVVEHHKNDRYYPEINPASQVASIGILAYFEAFCKHQFAAIGNIMPSLIKPFCKKRGEPSIEISTVASFNGDFNSKIGFILSEIYDFGTAKSINSLFYDLIKITPFSKEEEITFNDIVHRRNLLVHHAGYYTLQYSKKNNLSIEIQQQTVFNDAVKIDTEDYQKISDFLFDMAMKITRASVISMKAHPDFKLIENNTETLKVMEELLRGIHDFLDDF